MFEAIQDCRPTEILQAYWEEVVNIEQQAQFLEPVYFWEVER